MAQTIHLSHMPSELALYASMYKDVENATFLREQLLAGNTDFEYAFIDASTIVSQKHILAATFRAMNDYLSDRLKSKNVHSEIVFCLSPNNNIGEAFRRFGVQETTRDLLVLKVATSPEVRREAVVQHLNTSIKGTETTFGDESMSGASDLSKIKRIYKLGSGQPKSSVVNGDNSISDVRLDMEVQILGLMALRGAT